MRKLTILATMLVLVLVAASPAFAQVAVDDSIAIDNSNNVTFRAVAQNVVGDITTGDAIQRGDATATATRNSAASASVDADLDTSVSLTNRVGNFHHNGHYYDDWYDHYYDKDYYHKDYYDHYYDKDYYDHDGYGYLYKNGYDYDDYFDYDVCRYGGYTSHGVFIDITRHHVTVDTTGNFCLVDLDFDGFFGHHEYFYR